MTKLTESIKTLKGKRVFIPDCSRSELPELFKEMGYTTGAEIGVYKGEFTKLFCEAKLQMFAIDPWIGFKGQGRTQELQERQDFLYGHAQRVLAPYKDYTIIRKTSADALNDFKDGSLDFVYIDGDHSFPYIAFDIFNWAKKVKKGGIVSGHDYFSTNPKAQRVIRQVGPVIDAYMKAYDIQNWCYFGKDGRHDDKAFSWMFIKE